MPWSAIPSSTTTHPIGNLGAMGEVDRCHVVARVDEVLRIRAGGVY